MKENLIAADPPQPREMSGWIRLASAAKLARCAPETLARWCERGDVPIAIRQQGPRLKWVNAPQLLHWLGEPSLYTPEDVARANAQWAGGTVAMVSGNVSNSEAAGHDLF
jgi:hypothetical protein